MGLPCSVLKKDRCKKKAAKIRCRKYLAEKCSTSSNNKTSNFYSPSPQFHNHKTCINKLKAYSPGTVLCGCRQRPPTTAPVINSPASCSTPSLSTSTVQFSVSSENEITEQQKEQELLLFTELLAKAPWLTEQLYNLIQPNQKLPEFSPPIKKMDTLSRQPIGEPKETSKSSLPLKKIKTYSRIYSLSLNTIRTKSPPKLPVKLVLDKSSYLDTNTNSNNPKKLDPNTHTNKMDTIALNLNNYKSDNNKAKISKEINQTSPKEWGNSSSECEHKKTKKSDLKQCNGISSAKIFKCMAKEKSPSKTGNLTLSEFSDRKKNDIKAKQNPLMNSTCSMDFKPVAGRIENQSAASGKRIHTLVAAIKGSPPLTKSDGSLRKMPISTAQMTTSLIDVVNLREKIQKIMKSKDLKAKSPPKIENVNKTSKSSEVRELKSYRSSSGGFSFSKKV